jgi:hypothetical protein
LIPELFNQQDCPYVELNGEKIRGSLHEMIAKLSEIKANGNIAAEHQKNAVNEHKQSQEFYKKFIEPVEK